MPNKALRTVSLLSLQYVCMLSGRLRNVCGLVGVGVGVRKRETEIETEYGEWELGEELKLEIATIVCPI